MIRVAGNLAWVAGTPIGGLLAMKSFALLFFFITCGEMVVIPVGQALTASLSPEDMRGRYMGMYNLSWSSPYILGPWAAGLIMDNFNPNLLWYICGAVSVIPLTGFLMM